MKILIQYVKGSNIYYGIKRILITEDKIKLQVSEDFNITDIKTLESQEVESITVYNDF